MSVICGKGEIVDSRDAIFLYVHNFSKMNETTNRMLLPYRSQLQSVSSRHLESFQSLYNTVPSKRLHVRKRFQKNPIFCPLNSELNK